MNGILPRGSTESRLLCGRRGVSERGLMQASFRALGCGGCCFETSARRFEDCPNRTDQLVTAL